MKEKKVKKKVNNKTIIQKQIVISSVKNLKLTINELKDIKVKYRQVILIIGEQFF